MRCTAPEGVIGDDDKRRANQSSPGWRDGRGTRRDERGVLHCRLGVGSPLRPGSLCPRRLSPSPGSRLRPPHSAATSEQPFRRSSVAFSPCWCCSATPTRCWRTAAAATRRRGTFPHSGPPDCHLTSDAYWADHENGSVLRASRLRRRALGVRCRHVGRPHLARRHARNRVVGRDRARRRAAVDRRHGSCASEIITPAGCATRARTVPRRSARARRAQGLFPNTGPRQGSCLRDQVSRCVDSIVAVN